MGDQSCPPYNEAWEGSGKLRKLNTKIITAESRL